jgi:hypothetical protein
MTPPRRLSGAFAPRFADAAVAPTSPEINFNVDFATLASPACWRGTFDDCRDHRLESTRKRFLQPGGTKCRLPAAPVAPDCNRGTG